MVTENKQNEPSVQPSIEPSKKDERLSNSEMRSLLEEVGRKTWEQFGKINPNTPPETP